MAREILDQHRDIGGIAAERERGQGLFHRRDRGGRDVIAERLAPADTPILGLDPHQDVGERRPDDAAEAGGRPVMVDRHGHRYRLDPGNPHLFPLFFARIARSRPSLRSNQPRRKPSPRIFIGWGA